MCSALSTTERRDFGRSSSALKVHSECESILFYRKLVDLAASIPFMLTRHQVLVLGIGTGTLADFEEFSMN
jgi:hypothetical protein